jgi:hypothetical protein
MPEPVAWMLVVTGVVSVSTSSAPGDRPVTTPMTPDNRLDRIVEVLVNDTWWHGILEHWRQRDGRWEGWGRWSTGPGENRLGWQAAARPVCTTR